MRNTTDEPDTNQLEPLPVPLGEAKQRALNLSQFVGNNMGVFTESKYRAFARKSTRSDQKQWS